MESRAPVRRFTGRWQDALVGHASSIPQPYSGRALALRPRHLLTKPASVVADCTLSAPGAVVEAGQRSRSTPGTDRWGAINDRDGSVCVGLPPWEAFALGNGGDATGHADVLGVSPV